MTNPTIPQIQTALGDDIGAPTITKSSIDKLGNNELYVEGRIQKSGVTRWITTTVTDTAATQATAINANLAVG